MTQSRDLLEKLVKFTKWLEDFGARYETIETTGGARSISTPEWEEYKKTLAEAETYLQGKMTEEGPYSYTGNLKDDSWRQVGPGMEMFELLVSTTPVVEKCVTELMNIAFREGQRVPERGITPEEALDRLGEMAEQIQEMPNVTDFMKLDAMARLVGEFVKCQKSSFLSADKAEGAEKGSEP